MAGIEMPEWWEKARLRCDLATPGPWRWRGSDWQVGPPGRPAIATFHRQVKEGGSPGLYDYRANGLFVTCASEVFPRTLDLLAMATNVLRWVAQGGDPGWPPEALHLLARQALGIIERGRP